MKLNGGTQHSPCLLLAGPRGASMEPMEHSTAPRDCTTHCLCQLPIIYLRVRFRAPWMIPTTQTSFRARSVKGLRRGFDSPNGGEHSTLSPICTRDLHNAVTSSPPLPPLLRSAHTLCDPKRTFNPEKSKNGKRFRKVPAPFPNSPPQKLSGFTENLS